MNGVAYILLYLFLGVCLWMFVTFVFDNKLDKWLSLWIPVTATIMYFMVRLLADSIGLEKAGLIELTYMYLLILFYTKGSVWRNYFILCSCIVVQNVLINLLFMVDKSFEVIYVKYASGAYEMTLGQVGIVGFYQILSATLVTLLFRKLFKRNYKGNDTIYKVLTFVYIFLTEISAWMRNGYIEAMGTRDAKSYVITMMNLFFLFAMALLCGNIFNWYEAWRIRKEKKHLEEMVAENYNRLEKEIISPTLTNGLSGNLVLDSLLMGYSQVMNENGIVFEAMVQPSEVLQKDYLDVITILDDLLSVSFYCSKFVELEPFVWLSVRTVQGKLVVKLEFSKNKELSLVHPKMAVFDQERKQILRKHAFIKKIMETREGFMNVWEDEKEYGIQLLVQ